MYYKLKDFNNFNGFLIDICNSFLTIILQIYLNKNNNNNKNVFNELNYFIDFLFNIKMFDYLFKENLMFLTFKDSSYTKNTGKRLYIIATHFKYINMNR